LRCDAKVVYLSTDYIFDGKKGQPYLEGDSPCPLNAYGRSKLKGEQYVRELSKDSLIIRTQWLYGRYGKNFVDSVLRQAKEKKILRIVNDQIGSPTHTVDLSQAISSLIQCDAEGIFHAANSEYCSWYTFGQSILELSGLKDVEVIPISSEGLGRPATRPLYSAFNCQKLREKTGVTLRPWIEALKEYLSSGG
jgi:dTDP-4-dehydrorhamnose reductase